MEMNDHQIVRQLKEQVAGQTAQLFEANSTLKRTNEELERAIAGLRQTEEALRESESKYRLLTENASDVVWRLDSAYRFTYISPADERLRGYKADEVIGRQVFEMFNEEGVATIKKLARQRLEAEQHGLQMDTITFEAEHRCKDGRWLWAEIRYSAERDAEGKAIGFHGITREITERKQAQLALQQKNQELKQFVDSVSHDLKSPLITVKTFVDILRQDLQGGNQQQINDDLNYIDKAADKMERLLNALLQYSRIGTVDMDVQPLSVSQSVDECLIALAGILQKHQVQISTNEWPQQLQGDPLHFGQIWQNLIENSVKYMGNQAQPHIEIGVMQQAQDVVFYVRDNGMGIDPEHSERVFNLFFQLNPTDGSGLGLALVKKIVSIYQGRIWVDSAGKGQGSCFMFTLPGAVVNRYGNKTIEKKRSFCMLGISRADSHTFNK